MSIPVREGWELHENVWAQVSSSPQVCQAKVWVYLSASFLQSLMSAMLVSTLALFLEVAVGGALYYDHFTWYTSAAGAQLANTLVGICLATIALERTRKRSVRRTLELAFLNHHVHNALTQMTIASCLSARLRSTGRDGVAQKQ